MSRVLVLGDAIVPTDDGPHQWWAAARGRFGAPRRGVTRGGRGPRGVGLPAAEVERFLTRDDLD